MKSLLASIIFILSASVYCAEVKVDPLVLIEDQGLVRGLKSDDGQYSSFLGIPYAAVDLDNPFGPANAPPPFDEIVHNAFDGSAKCSQLSSDATTTLDCLKLNIYVPFAASSLSPMPVLFWIHGGEFVRGSASEYSGVKNIVRHDVIVVTINYRLGPYGFMCLDVPGVAGNQGLKDQYLALQWVRKKISAFGGNPYNVTIGGQDAGATSTLLHLYSDKEKLYHKAIVQSGTPQNGGMFVNGDVEAAIKIAARLGFNTTVTKEALDYLTWTDHDLVAVAALDLGLELKPCKERSFSGVENFVENDPYALSNKKKVRTTSILIGFTNKEYNTLSDDYYNSDPFYKKIQNNFNLEGQDIAFAANIVKHFYIGDRSISSDVASELEDFESDFDVNHPTQRLIDNLIDEEAGSIYEYLFSYVGDSGDVGAPHYAELKYLFELSSTAVDQLTVDRVTALWTNFIKYGNPTPSTTELLPVTWTPVTKSERPTLVIDSELTLEGQVFHDRMAFWDLFYSVYGKFNKIVRECALVY